MTAIINGVPTAIDQKELDALQKEHPEWFLPPPPSAEERLAALEEAMIAMMGGNI